MAMASSYLRKHIFLPQDHGSWVFIFSPLFVGIFAGNQFTLVSLSLVVAVVAAFLIRQPVTMAVKAYAGRRTKSDIPAALVWMVVYAIILLLALHELVNAGFGYMLVLGIPGVFVFAWHLRLISQRQERRQVNVEIIATGVLSLAAPAAYWVGMGRYDPTGWWLWILVWLQTAASILHAYMRLEQRELREVPPSRELLNLGLPALIYTTLNLIMTLSLGLASSLPPLLFIPYLVQWLETVWGVFHPAIQWKPTRIGIRQLIVSTLWTILFIATWRIG
ncbi:MAG TPA: YwiC-like family protein [Anaerolineales bacterium]|nr:YwiC-like family protein [Anaerolineales bacterium]